MQSEFKEDQLEKSIKNKLQEMFGTYVGFVWGLNDQMTYQVLYAGMDSVDISKWESFSQWLNNRNRERAFRLRCEKNRFCYLMYVIDPTSIEDYALEDTVVHSYTDYYDGIPETVYTLRFDLSGGSVEGLEHLIYKLTRSDENIEELISFTCPIQKAANGI